jgi:large subunit ribosomal protein L25
MKYPLLNAEARTVLGKKIKKLRREGLLPANVYGKGLSSQALQVMLSDFQAIYKEVGETGLVDLKVAGKSHPVLIKNLQMDYSSQLPLHADFYQVNLKEKVKTMVPIVLIGEAKAVSEKIGVLLQTLSEVEVEALPDKLPENIEVDVESLAEIDASVTVGDVKAGEGVAILTDPGITIVKISEPQKEEPVEVAAEEGAVEGETPAEDGKAESTEETKEPEKAEEK